MSNIYSLNNSITTADEVLNAEIISYKITIDLAELEATNLKDKLKPVSETAKELILTGKATAPTKLESFRAIKELETLSNNLKSLKFRPIKMGCQFRSPTTSKLELDYQTYKKLLEYLSLREKLEKDIRVQLEETRRSEV